MIMTEEREDHSIRAMGYHDIMILGLTGQGKTTTADKLLIANPEGIIYQSKYADEAEDKPRVDMSRHQVAMQDLYMWLIPEDEDKIKEISIRIKGLAFHRVLKDPHQQVNADHESGNHSTERTLKCELLSNETTKVRVLDVPGFFGEVRNPDRDSHNITLNAKETHLGTMRNILQIQAAMAMKFKRILYFLPCRDTLQTSNAALQEELQLMCYYFGRSIFEVMVLVATLGPTFYRIIPETSPVDMPYEELERSRAVFREALRSFLPVDTPDPSIIFVSLRESCESILQKVQEAEVANNDGLQLRLNSTVCSRCSMTIGERKGMRVACTSGGKWSESILYEDSHCHPFFVPKYTTLQKITGGVTYTVKAVVNREQWQWPDFSVEKCHKCGRRPGTQGCLLVGSEYDIDEESHLIDHTSMVEEYASNHRWLFQDDTESNQSRDRAAMEGDGEDYRDLLSDSSVGFEHREVTESFERREVRVDIEPGHSPQASLVTRTPRSRGTIEGGASNFPEIEVLDSSKRDT